MVFLPMVEGNKTAKRAPVGVGGLLTAFRSGSTIAAPQFAMGTVAGKAMGVRVIRSPLALMLVLAVLACSGLNESEEHYNAGVDLQQQGRLEDAIAEYDQAIRLNPRAAFYRNLGLAYIEHGDSQRAILDLNEAIRLEPDYMRAFANRARVSCGSERL